MNLIVTKREAIEISLLSAILLSTLLVLASCGTSSSPSEAGAAINPISRDVRIGDTFTFDVLIDTEVPSRGAQCTLTFDPKMTRCDGVTEGDFYRDWASANGCTAVLFPGPVIDNENGQVSSIGIAILGTQEGGAKGKGVLFSYHFTAIADGVAAPTLSNVVITDQSGNALKKQ
ncbi:MAG: cohesin domain-containing protein [Dehalococcoidia bacterium]|nr:cohesin domain-containing protein [Dehalococcoidia bacterium]